MKTHKKIMIAISILIALGAVGTAIAEYITWTAITNVSITSHNDYDPVSVGQEYTLTCTTSTDADCHVGVGAVSDPIVHTWSGPGTFDPQTGTTVTWIPPDSNGNATITVTASDDGSPAYADDTDKTDSVILTVQNTLYYVDVGASGNDDGTSWTDAYNDLQDALDAVISGDEIWVAEGTYEPTTDANRAISFELVDGVGVYGGFDATETARSQRDWNNNVTILSGDISSIGDNTDNSYNVVYSEDCDTDTILDGFTITGGNAHAVGGGLPCKGGGMHNEGSSPSVTNCIFTDNSAFMGGGMYNHWYADPVVTNCTFSGNSAGGLGGIGGGMMLHDYADATLINCTFFNNWTFDSNYGSEGGGIHVSNSCPTIANCTFIGNLAAGGTVSYGGGLSAFYSNFELTNCIFWGNNSNYDGEEILTSLSTNLTISYCDIDGGWDGAKVVEGYESTITDGGGNIDSAPCFVNIFDFSDGTTASGTTTTIKVADASIYNVNDEIEYHNDGVARKVTNVNTTTDIITFANDALAANSVSCKTIYNWGIGATDMDEDVHLVSDSDCIDAGDPDGTYTGQKDMDGEDRVNGSEVDIGADEYYSS